MHSSCRPPSLSLEFPRFEGPGYERAMELARDSAELLEIGSGASVRHRAPFYPLLPWSED